MKVMAVDLGDVRTGVAFSDLTGFLAGRSVTVTCRDRALLLDKLCGMIEEERPEEIVLGLPKNMDGTEGPRADKSREVARLLTEATGLEVRLWDERRSSIEAHAILHANGRREKKHHQTVDAVAASLILEGFLGAHGSEYRA